MLLSLPLVTIVTPTFNAGRYLTEAIESVLSQDYLHIEYLVVDGHSTDNSLRILKGYKARLRIIHAAARGPAGALATGFSQARGSVFGWLNADDRYGPGAVRRAVETFLRCS